MSGNGPRGLAPLGLDAWALATGACTRSTAHSGRTMGLPMAFPLMLAASLPRRYDGHSFWSGLDEAQMLHGRCAVPIGVL